jgi:hypothetical protein
MRCRNRAIIVRWYGPFCIEAVQFQPILFVVVHFSPEILAKAARELLALYGTIVAKRGSEQEG